MKKTLIFLLAVLFVLTTVLLVACDAKIVSLKIDGAPGTVERGETIDYSKINVVVSYDNDTTVTLALTDEGVKYTAIDTSTTGNKKLEVRYGGKTASVYIEVTESNVDVDGAIIVSYDNTSGYGEYLIAIQDQSNDETEFFDRDVIYTVGTDNGYKFLPYVRADVNEEIVVLEDVTTTFKLYRKVNGSFAEVESTSDWLDNVENNVYYFNHEAEGEIFKLEVSLGEGYILIDEEMNTTVSQEFAVVSGYNVYDALGLSVLDNRNVISWSEIKQTILDWDNGKALNEFGDVTQIIIHNNITVTVDDLPDNYFWDKEADAEAKPGGKVSFADAQSRAPGDLRQYLEGSIKEIYLGEEWEGESDGGQRALYVSNGIGISGNCLKLSYSSNFDESNPTGKGIYIVHDTSQTSGKETAYPESHTSFVCFTHAIEGTKEEGILGTRTIENVYFVGETSKTENVTTPAGLMMMTSDMANVKITNTIGANWYCNAELDGVGVGTLAVDKCKFYDSFSQMIFSWGTVQLDITNSEMKRTGGPIIIMQTITSKKTRETILNIDENSVMESWVTGSEMWFTINLGEAAPIAAQLFAAATLPDNTQNTHYRRITSDGKVQVNLVAITIPEPGDVFTNQQAIPGTINIGDDSYGMDEPVFNALISLSANAGTGANLVDTTLSAVSALGMQLDSNTQAQLNALKAGFANLQKQTAALYMAPIYKCGNEYAYASGANITQLQLYSLADITTGVQQLYGGVVTAVIPKIDQIIAGLQAQGQDAAVAQAQALKNSWTSLANALAPLGTLTVDTDNWTTNWTAGYLSFWVNPGAMGQSSNKHFLVLLGEDNIAAE